MAGLLDSDLNNAESLSRSRSRTRTDFLLDSNSRDLDPEAVLLRAPSARDRAGRVPGHTLITAPIVTGDAFHALGPAVFPQRALYGTVISQHANGFPECPRVPKVYINSNTPFSAVVCGVQGSGKSHSTSVLLESCLIQDERLGTLPAPLSGLVFHFGSAAGGGMEQPCEAAYLSALDSQLGGSATPPHVTVLAMPASVPALAKVYAGLPRVDLKPLRFAPQDITADRLLAMMKVEEGGKMPLYMEYIMNVLRRMEGNFNYDEFRKQLKAQEFNPGQKAMLNMRLALLDSCLEGGNASNRVPNYFKKGHLTIIDLSSPFMDSSSACGLFDIILGLFVGTKTDSTGKIVVLDEAHKYLTDDGSSQRLTESLLTVIREQRHLATRVVISTQEPTVVPAKFLDLCSFVIAHRFSSPEWLRHLSKHVSAAVSSEDDLYDQVSSLETGEALLFAPAGLGLRSALFGDLELADGPAQIARQSPVARFGRGHLLVSSRLRITQDGGQSVLAVQDSAAPRENGLSLRSGEQHRVDRDAAPWPTPPAAEEDLAERSLTPMSVGRADDGFRKDTDGAEAGSNGAHGDAMQAHSRMDRASDIITLGVDVDTSEPPFVPLESKNRNNSSESADDSGLATFDSGSAQMNPMEVFAPLIKLLGGYNHPRVPWPTVAYHLAHKVSPPAVSSGKREYLEPYLQAAADAGLIILCLPSSPGLGWVELSPSSRAALRSPAIVSPLGPEPDLRPSAPRLETMSSLTDNPSQPHSAHPNATPAGMPSAGVIPPANLSPTPDAFQHIVSVLKTLQQKVPRRRIAECCTLRPDLSTPELLASCLRDLKEARIVDEDVEGVWLIASPQLLRTLGFGLPLASNPQSVPVPAAAAEAGSPTAPMNSAASANPSSGSAGGPSFAPGEKVSFVDGIQDLASLLNNMHRAGNSKVSISVIAQWLVAHPVLSKPDMLARCLQSMKSANIIDEDSTGVWLTWATAARPVSAPHGAPPAGPASAATREATGAPSSAPPHTINTSPAPSNIYSAAPSTTPISGRNEALHAGVPPATSFPAANRGTPAAHTTRTQTPPPPAAPLGLVGDYPYLVSLLKTLHRAGHAKVTVNALARSCPFHPELSKPAEFARCLRSMKAARVIDDDRYGIWLTRSGEVPGPAGSYSTQGTSSGDPPAREPTAGPSFRPASAASSSADARARASGATSSVPFEPSTDIRPPPVSAPVVPARFAPLVSLLREQRQRGVRRVAWTNLGAALKSSVLELAEVKLKVYLGAAVEAGLVNLGAQTLAQQGWVELRDYHVSV